MWQNSGDAVIPQARRPAEYERVARTKQQRLHRIATPKPTEKKPRRVADRQRHDGPSRLQRFPALVFVLVNAQPSLVSVPINQADIGMKIEAGRGSRAACEACEVVWQRGHGPAIKISASPFVLIGERIPVAPQGQHSHAHLAAAAHCRRVPANSIIVY